MSLYAVTLPCFAQMLRSLTTLLAKGEEHARARGFDAQNLLDARLAPDMHTLARQVELAARRRRKPSAGSRGSRCRGSPRRPAWTMPGP